MATSDAIGCALHQTHDVRTRRLVASWGMIPEEAGQGWPAARPAIDWVEDVRGSGLAITNPNAPPPVKSMTVQELHDRIVAGAIDVIDVRPAQARAIAPFPQPHEVLDEDSHDRLAALPKDLPLAFLCHHGNSSRQAAEHFRGLGFHDIYNVEGGIDAWATEVDPKVPRY